MEWKYAIDNVASIVCAAFWKSPQSLTGDSLQILYPIETDNWLEVVRSYRQWYHVFLAFKDASVTYLQFALQSSLTATAIAAQNGQELSSLSSSLKIC